MAFPSPPWRLCGDAWGSLFRAAAPGEPTATWAVGLVAYDRGSTLSYSELVVARVKDPLRGEVEVREMWVDSPTSREAGRALWALPKEMATFHHDAGGLTPLGRHAWRVRRDGAVAVEAEFLDTAVAAVRTPVRGAAVQPRADGTTQRSPMRGSARLVPCLARWEIDPRGPLGWLGDRSPLVSFRVRDFRLTFG